MAPMEAGSNYSSCPPCRMPATRCTPQRGPVGSILWLPHCSAVKSERIAGTIWEPTGVIGIGEWAALGTALAWTLSALAWTASTLDQVEHRFRRSQFVQLRGSQRMVEPAWTQGGRMKHAA